MLSCSIWFSAPSFWMGGGLESRCVGRVYGADGAVQSHGTIRTVPKVHYRTHKRPPPVSILGQPNLVHILTSHLLEIHPNIIYPSTPR